LRSLPLQAKTAFDERPGSCADVRLIHNGTL
jgi:hypothetical protein